MIHEVLIKKSNCNQKLITFQKKLRPRNIQKHQSKQFMMKKKTLKKIDFNQKVFGKLLTRSFNQKITLNQRRLPRTTQREIQITRRKIASYFNEFRFKIYERGSLSSIYKEFVSQGVVKMLFSTTTSYFLNSVS